MSRGIRALVIFFAFVLVYTVARPNLQHGSTHDTIVPDVHLCVGSQISPHWINGSGAAGSVYSWIRLTNTADTCKLPTWLSVSSSRNGGSKENFVRVENEGQLTRQNGGAIQASKSGVVVLAGKSAFIAVSFSDRYSCPQADLVTLSWMGTGATQSITAWPTYLATSCAGNSVVMSPVYR